jgi:hypothetical protein
VALMRLAPLLLLCGCFDFESLCQRDGVQAGCADGSRDFLSALCDFPNIAACAGAWAVPGVVGVSPSCGRASEGQGCSAADLCADGWHLCGGRSEVGMLNGQAACDQLAQTHSFFVTAERGVDGTTDCGGVAPDANNVFGCGGIGGPIATCAPLNRRMSQTPGECPSPWCCGPAPTCVSADNRHEGLQLTKRDDTTGGVLCCRDNPR